MYDYVEKVDFSLELKKKIGGNHTFFLAIININSLNSFKILNIVGMEYRYNFFSKLNLKIIISEKCMVTPNFLFGFQ